MPPLKCAALRPRRGDQRLAGRAVARVDQRGSGVEERHGVHPDLARREHHAPDLAAEGLRVAARAGYCEDDERTADRRGLGLALGAGARRLVAGVGPEVRDRFGRYSHSMVPGGLDVMSSTTRLTSRISLIIREAMRSSRS